LDLETLQNIKSDNIITIEDNVFLGGLGSMIDGVFAQRQNRIQVKNFAYRDEFIHQGKVSDLQKKFGVDKAEIERYIMEILK
jgi:1-deoxy-D-xylulose-5-phosphate synthase